MLCFNQQRSLHLKVKNSLPFYWKQICRFQLNESRINIHNPHKQKTTFTLFQKLQEQDTVSQPNLCSIFQGLRNCKVVLCEKRVHFHLTFNLHIFLTQLRILL